MAYYFLGHPVYVVYFVSYSILIIVFSDNCMYLALHVARLVNSVADYRRKASKHGRRKKNGSRVTARRLRDYEKTYVTAGGGMLGGGGISGSCRLLYDSHRRSAYEPPTNPLPVGQLALQSLSTSGTMFIDPDPLCPSHGHLYRTRHGGRHHPSTHSLLVDHWDSAADTVDPTTGAGGAEPRCPGCHRLFTAADVCHCDCARPDVAADVDRPPALPSPPLDGGTGARLPTPPPAMLQTDDLKLQKTRRKSSPSGATATPTSAVAARKQSAETTSLHPPKDLNSSGHRAGEIEPLLVTASLPYDDDDEAAGDVNQLTSPLRAIGSSVCHNVDQRVDFGVSAGGSDVTRTAT